MAPETVHDFYKQRFRWAAGGLQIFKHHNALGKRGLSFTQKFLYFWAGFSTCLSVAMLYLIICPIFFLLGQDKLKLATFDTMEYFMYFLPFLFLQALCMRISYRGLDPMYLKRSFQESVFMLFCYARAVITVMVGIKLGFKVTNKDGDSSAFRKSFNWCIPFVIYYLLAIPSMCFGVIKMVAAYNSSPHHDPSTMIAVVVSLFWITLIMWQMWPPMGFLLQGLIRDYNNNKKEKEAAALAAATTQQEQGETKEKMEEEEKDAAVMAV